MLRWYCLVSLDRLTVTPAGGRLGFSSSLLCPFLLSRPLRCWYLPSIGETQRAMFSSISLLTSNQAVFVFFLPLWCSHNLKWKYPFKSASQYAVSNILFTAYGLYIRMRSTTVSVCSHNHVEENHRARCLALVLQRLCFPLSLCKIHPSLFYLFPRFHRLNN